MQSMTFLNGHIDRVAFRYSPDSRPCSYYTGLKGHRGIGGLADVIGVGREGGGGESKEEEGGRGRRNYSL